MNRSNCWWRSLLLATIGGLVWPTAGKCQTAISARSEADRQAAAATNAALSRNADVDFKDATLADLTKFVNERTGLNVVLDHKALEDAGIAEDSAGLNLQVRGAPLAGIFELGLRQLDLSWHIHKGMILVTTPEEEEQSGLDIQVYPVADLVRVRRGVANDEGELDDFDTLMDLLVTSVAPDSWDEVGGPGSIDCWPNRSALVISQTREVHERVGRALEALRKAPPPVLTARTMRPSRPAAGRGSRAIGPAADADGGPAASDSSSASRPQSRGQARWQLPQVYE